ncbi:hypothetical protein [Spirosoma arcticum]
MSAYSNIALTELLEFLRKSSANLDAIWYTVPFEIDKENDTIVYKITDLQKILDNVRELNIDEFPNEIANPTLGHKLHEEIINNLLSFDRESQETFYYYKLMSFMSILGAIHFNFGESHIFYLKVMNWVDKNAEIQTRESFEELGMRYKFFLSEIELIYDYVIFILGPHATSHEKFLPDRGPYYATFFPTIAERIASSHLKFMPDKRQADIQSQTGSIKQTDTNDNSVSAKIIGFDTYIDESCREHLMPFLINRYKGTNPKQFVYMLFALLSLKLIKRLALNYTTQLHLALTKTFDSVGSRQFLGSTINTLSGESEAEKLQIHLHAQEISAFLSSK